MNICDAGKILEQYATNRTRYPGWEDRQIDFKVGPATAELHSSYNAFRHLYGVCVKPRKRGQGHGRRLMDVIVAYADVKGHGLELDVLADNEPAVRLYRSVGFRITHTRPRADYDQRVIHWMERYPARIPATDEWDRHFEAKALWLEREHEPRMGGDFWVAFFDALYKAQMTPDKIEERERYGVPSNYWENTRRLSCDATGALLEAAGWTVTRTEAAS